MKNIPSSRESFEEGVDTLPIAVRSNLLTLILSCLMIRVDRVPQKLETTFELKDVLTHSINFSLSESSTGMQISFRISKVKRQKFKVKN